MILKNSENLMDEVWIKWELGEKNIPCQSAFAFCPGVTDKELAKSQCDTRFWAEVIYSLNGRNFVLHAALHYDLWVELGRGS